MMMEMDMLVYEDAKKKKNSRMHMILVNMDEEQSMYNMADYQTMNFGGTAKN
jgi:hypothetical protein